MPPTVARGSARRRRKTPVEEPENQVMAPTRMKLRVRRSENTNAAEDTNTAAPEAQDQEQQQQQLEEEEEESTAANSRQSSSNRKTRKRKKTKNSNSAATTAAASSSAPAASSSANVSASARNVLSGVEEEASPDSKCPICLDRFNNLAYLDRCLHRFCFPCIQEWSHNKAECPLCKQPFTSILHSVRAEDDFKEYTLRPPPANSSVAATVAMVAAMASAARSDHQMRLMLRRHRGAEGEELSGRGGEGDSGSRRRRRERAGRVWEWYLESPYLSLPLLPPGTDTDEPMDTSRHEIIQERGVIFEGLSALGGAAAPVVANDRSSRRLLTRLAARQRVQREGGSVRRLRERETVALRRALYLRAIRVRGVPGVQDGVSDGVNQGPRDITAESFRDNPVSLNRLRPWLRRELTVLYGAHGSLVDIVQRIIMARLARHGLEDHSTIEEELRPFLLARTDHFLHELVSFARSPLSLESYDLQCVYEPPDAMEVDGSSSEGDGSVIAISEGEEEPGNTGGNTGSCLSLSVWDDETPGPSYSTANEPSCSLTLSPPTQDSGANHEAGDKEEECLIVGYKKPIAERTPELVQLSSDSDGEAKRHQMGGDTKSPNTLSCLEDPAGILNLPAVPPSTSGDRDAAQPDTEKDDGGCVDVRGSRARSCSRARSWSGCSAGSRDSVTCTLRETRTLTGRERDGKSKKKRRKKSRSTRAETRPRRSGVLTNPNRSLFPGLRGGISPCSSGSSGAPSPVESACSLSSSPLGSSLASSAFGYSPYGGRNDRHSSQTPPTPSLSPSNTQRSHSGEKPGGKRKYKSRHLDSDDRDPTWQPARDATWPRGKGARREKEKKKKKRREGGDSRRPREDRSPSVEIIYEGTISSCSQPSARRRRKQRHRHNQHNSSPVIITLDSDSSHDNDIHNNKNTINNNSSSVSSSPLSSQQTVDFSDLPPLSLAHSPPPAIPLAQSADVGGTSNHDIITGELPADILDRDLSPRIAVDNNNSDNENEVDVEKVDLANDDDDEENRPMREADSSFRRIGELDSASSNLAAMDPASDSRLLANILDDLMEINAPKSDLNYSTTAAPLLDTNSYHNRKRRLIGGHSTASSNTHSWFDSWRNPNSDNIANFSNNIQTPSNSESTNFCNLIPPLTSSSIESKVRDVPPPLLKQTSPVRPHNNKNTLPPLKHKNAGGPNLPVDLPNTSNNPEEIGLGPNVNPSPYPTFDARFSTNAIPSISTLKRPFASVSTTSSTAAFDNQPAFTVGAHSSRHKRPSDSNTSSSSTSENASTKSATDRSPLLESFLSFSAKLNSLRDSFSLSGAAASDLNSVDSNALTTKTVSPKENQPFQTNATSESCRNNPIENQDSMENERDIFSGLNSNESHPVLLVPSEDSFSHSSAKRGRLSPTRVSLASSPSRTHTLSPPTQMHHRRRRSPKSTLEDQQYYTNRISPPTILDSRTQNSLNDSSHFSSRRNSQSERASLVLTPTPPPPPTHINIHHRRSPNKSSADLPISSSSSSNINSWTSANHELSSPHHRFIDLPVSSANAHSPSSSSGVLNSAVDVQLNHSSSGHVNNAVDENLMNYTAALQTDPQRNYNSQSQSEFEFESNSKRTHTSTTQQDYGTHNNFKSTSNAQFSTSDSKHYSCVERECVSGSQATHSKSSHTEHRNSTVENNLNVNSSMESDSDSELTIDERSTTSDWNSHTNSAT